ncbi:hypothetical protein KP509_15G026600 [Ceratopteris richardii]|uniref:DUF2470 domain-containing protein n=1 Tax=Ceratopteris richardii TaxID=49495 RepID=A0A8T2T7Y2_CERRI|nr:hypothetical protein KP509_15G026600 [Ceratopteris richardii]
MNSLLMQGAGVSTRAQRTLPPISPLKFPPAALRSASVVRWPSLSDCQWGCTGRVFRSEKQRLSRCSLCVFASSTSVPTKTSVRPSPAESSRTLSEVCNEGVLCTSSSDGWPLAGAVRFAVELELGSPFFYLAPFTLHSKNLQEDRRCCFHIQMEQPGHRKPQCTFKGDVSKVDDESLKQKLRTMWSRRFGEDPKDDGDFYLMNIESVLHSLDIGEDCVWVSNSQYRDASPDPLRECAVNIVEDMNRNHWEDLRRFCKVYANLDLLVEEARLSWVDRLGFDMCILTANNELVEVRIPFSREVIDERDARSSLTMMAQISWEYERNYNPPEIQLVKS